MVLGVFFANGLMAMLNMNDRMDSNDDKANRGDILQWLLKLLPNIIFSDVTFTEQAGVRMSL